MEAPQVLGNQQWVPTAIDAATHRERIMSELRDLGVSRLGMKSSEAKYLPSIIHSGERLGGVVYGLHEAGFVMLVATDRRIIFLDTKPLFTDEDEVDYTAVSGVELSHVGVGSMLTLHTKIKDFIIRTFNLHCAQGFIHYIERRCLEHNGGYMLNPSITPRA